MMKIFVKAPLSITCADFRVYNLEVSPDDLVQTVKQKIQDGVYTAGLPPGYRLIMKCSLMRILDDGKTLSHYNIQKGASILATFEISADVDLSPAVVVIKSSLDESRGTCEFIFNVNKSTTLLKIFHAAAKAMGIVDGDIYSSLRFLYNGLRVPPYATCKLLDEKEDRFDIDVLWGSPQVFRLIGGKAFRCNLRGEIEQNEQRRKAEQTKQMELTKVKEFDELSSLSAGSDFDHYDNTTPATTALQVYSPLAQDAALKAKLVEHSSSLQLKASDLQHKIQLDQKRLAKLLSVTREVQQSLADLQNQARENDVKLNAAKQHVVKMQAAENALAFVDRQKRELLEYLDKEASSQLLKRARN